MPARLARILHAAALALLLAACGGHDPSLPGAYAGQTPQGAVTLELKESGKGVWSTAAEDITLTWERRGDEVWLHTKAGGVIVCAIRPGGSLLAQAPGVGEIALSKDKR